MEYHSVDLLSSTDSSGNSYNPYNILYAYFIFSSIPLSLSDNYFLFFCYN